MITVVLIRNMDHSQWDVVHTSLPAAMGDVLRCATLQLAVDAIRDVDDTHTRGQPRHTRQSTATGRCSKTTPPATIRRYHVAQPSELRRPCGLRLPNSWSAWMYMHCCPRLTLTAAVTVDQKAQASMSMNKCPVHSRAIPQQPHCAAAIDATGRRALLHELCSSFNAALLRAQADASGFINTLGLFDFLRRHLASTASPIPSDASRPCSHRMCESTLPPGRRLSCRPPTAYALRRRSTRIHPR